MPHRPTVRILSLFLLAIFSLYGCFSLGDHRSSYGTGVYHTVLQGQTLYSIARTYGVPVQEIQRLNGIAYPQNLETGRRIWVPGAYRVLQVPVAVDSAPARRKGKSVTAKGREKPGTAKSKHILQWPVPGGVLTSHYGKRGRKNHDGIDIGARRGTEIRAAASGIVKFSGWGPTGYGLMVIIKHHNKLTTVYAHNSKNFAKKGQRVRRGEVIALVGKTGRATGNHVHFEVRNDTHARNPLHYMSQP